MDVTQANVLLREAVFDKRFKPSGGSGRLLVKFSSHRQRDNALRSVLKGERKELTSFYRETGRGVYEVTPEELQALRDAKIKFSKFKDGDDLRGTMKMGYPSRG